MRLVVWATLLLLAAGCVEDSAKPGSGPGRPGRFAGAEGRPPTLVVAEPAVMRPIADVVEAIGTARANESVTITATVTDTIRQIRFEDGDFVQKGDVLVELTNEEQTALLAEAEANVQDALNQFTRLDDLLEQRSVPVSDVDEARARLSGARARYQAIVARLDDRLIRAPFKGLLGFRQVSAGTLITPGTSITTLDDVSIIKLDFAVPEIYLGVVKPGLTLTAFSPAFPEEAFTASVKTIASRVDPVTRAATVRAHIDNADLFLRPGMLMTVKLTTSSRDALMVRETALLQRGAETFVYTISGDREGGSRATMTAIDTGVRRGGWMEVLAGLSSGEEVITEGVIKVRDRAPVRTAEASASAFPGVRGRPAGEGAPGGRPPQRLQKGAQEGARRPQAPGD